jgi:hypothetical protein
MLWVWLSIFAISLVCCAAAAFHCRFGGHRGAFWLLTRFGAVGVAFVALSDLAARIPQEMGVWSFLARASVLAFASFAACGVLMIPTERFAPRISWALLAAALLCAGWFSQQFYLAASPNNSDLLDLSEVAALQRGSHSLARAYTNEGRVIGLYEGAVPEKEYWLPTAMDHPAFAGRLIATGPSDARYNCHGWAFAGGAYAVNGESVDMILQDNRYQPVEAPEPNDLAIWRDAEGHPVHTGIVKAIGDDFVLIESKWGMSGRYLHVPQDQGYSHDFTYYRSSRLGHVLHIALPGETPSPASSPGTLAARPPAGESGAEAIDLHQLGAE